MELFTKQWLLMTLLVLFVSSTGAMWPSRAPDSVVCRNKHSPCYFRTITCPPQCADFKPKKNPKAKGCFIDCFSPKCEAVCKGRKPDCDGPGAACFDPRFIGGDGIVFYFHGRSNEQYCLVSDPNIQINARFIGHRPSGRTRDYTWIQALGIMLGPHNLTVEAKKVETWDDQVDQLEFSFDGKPVKISEGHLSEWNSTDQKFKVERTSNKNSVTVTLLEFAEISINVVPITENDNKIHNYQVPSNDCFAHLEVQFRFVSLSPEVEGVLGRTYRPDFVNPAKPGVAMPVVGGENKYRTSTLLSVDCTACIFTPAGVENKKKSILVMDHGISDCTFGRGNGIVCKK